MVVIHNDAPWLYLMVTLRVKIAIDNYITLVQTCFFQTQFFGDNYLNTKYLNENENCELNNTIYLFLQYSIICTDFYFHNVQLGSHSNHCMLR
jgi:hypothetical protein